MQKKKFGIFQRFFKFQVIDSESTRHKKSLNNAILLTQIILLMYLIVETIFLLIARMDLNDFERLAFLCAFTGSVNFVIFFLNNYRSNSVASIAFLILVVLIIFFGNTVENVTQGSALVIWIFPVVVASIISSPRSSFFIAVFISCILTIVPILNGEIPNIYAIGVILLAGLLIWSLTNSFLKVLNHSRANEQALQKIKEDQAKYIDQILLLNLNLEERTKALKEAHEQMMRQEKLAAIGKLAGSVGHELRNPLGVITNSIYYLELKFPITDEKIKKHLKIIQEESMKANKIISELLDFARSKPDKALSIDLCVLIKDSLEQVQKPENITLDLCFEQDILNVKVDPRKMQQSFQNIITNAYQAMPDGGTLSIQVKNDAGEIEVCFKDTGVGIPPENLTRLFEPLFSTKIKGVGLGLFIAKEIVEQYKGTIEVESEVGVGSTFLVRLPIGNHYNDLATFSVLPEIEDKNGEESEKNEANARPR